MTAPYDALPPDAPATVEDVRATRRWTWVAFAWAIAASVIAVLALIQANDNSGSDRGASAPDLTPRMERLEKQTSDRLDAFSRRLNQAAADGDVRKLDKRLSQVEDDLSKVSNTASDQTDAIDQLKTDLEDLKQRVDDLEQQQAQGQAP